MLYAAVALLKPATCETPRLPKMAALVVLALMMGLFSSAPEAAASQPPSRSPQHAAAGDTADAVEVFVPYNPSRTDAVSGIQFQNLDPTRSADVLVHLFPPDGSAPVPQSISGIPSGFAGNLWVPHAVGEAQGDYAAVATSDRLIDVIARAEWTQRGARRGAALYGDCHPGTDLIVPLVVKDFHSQSSVLSIQNTSADVRATATLKLYPRGKSTEVLTMVESIPERASLTLDVHDHPALDRLPQGFIGTARILSRTRLAAAAFVRWLDPGWQVVYGFEGVPAQEAAATLYMPLFRSGFYGTTGLAVANPGPSPVEVQVAYTGTLGSCVGETFQETRSVAPSSNVVFYQGDGRLPTGCAGTAVARTAAGAIVAIANDALGDPSRPLTSAAYNVPSAAQGAQLVHLPLLRRTHARPRLTTGVQAMNVGRREARAAITIYDSSGREYRLGRQADAVIPAGGAYTWYMRALQGMPDDSYGAGSITSDEPLVVIVNDAPELTLTAYPMDAALYNAIPDD